MLAKLIVNLSSICFVSGSTFFGISLFTRPSVLDILDTINPINQEKDEYYNPHLTSASVFGSKTRKYLMDNVFSLRWKGNDNSPTLNNAFLLNFFSDNSGQSWKTGDSYVPQWDSPTSKVHLLIGTTLTFAKTIFDKISDFNLEVNNAKTPVTLDDSKSSNYSTHDLYISQTSINSSDFTEKKDPIYEIKTSKLTNTDDMTNNINQFTKIEKDDIKLLYVSSDLSINSDVYNLSHSSNVSTIAYNLQKIKNKSNKSIYWQKPNENNLFVDFAAIQISISTTKLKEAFKHYLNNLYLSHYQFNPVVKDNIGLVNNKVKKMALAGWKPLSQIQKEKLIFSKLMFELLIKKEKKSSINSTLPSTINKENFSDWFEIKFFNTVVDAHDQYKDKYEIFNPELMSNNASGVVIIRFQIKHKDSNYVFPKKFSTIFGDFSKADDQFETEAVSFDNENLSADNFLEKQQNQFLETIESPLMEWNEFAFNDGYFDFSTVYEQHKNSLNSRQQNENSPVLSFTHKNKNYVNIGHHIDVVGPKIDSNLKGSLVLSYDWNKKQKNELLGTYAGSYDYFSKLLGTKTTNKILMLNSPTRYDIFNACNNFSRPSLGDSLIKKGLDKTLIKKHVFSTSSKNC